MTAGEAQDRIGELGRRIRFLEQVLDGEKAPGPLVLTYVEDQGLTVEGGAEVLLEHAKAELEELQAEAA
jgi:hypothetical protein